jgi:DNA-binding NarL/FixJ family response regulator
MPADQFTHGRGGPGDGHVDVIGCAASLPAGLTERELDVLRLLAVGRTEPRIAGDLVISQSMVHTHTVHIYAKCGVSIRAGLAMFAMWHGLAARTGPAAAKID